LPPEPAHDHDSNRFPLAEQGHRPRCSSRTTASTGFNSRIKNLMPPILWQAIKRVAER